MHPIESRLSQTAKARAIRNSTKIEDIVTQFVDRHCKPNIKAWQNQIGDPRLRFQSYKETP